MSKAGSIAKMGSLNPRTKLTWEQVEEIRETYSQNSQKTGIIASLSRAYDMTPQGMGRIINGITWTENPKKGEIE